MRNKAGIQMLDGRALDLILVHAIINIMEENNLPQNNEVPAELASSYVSSSGNNIKSRWKSLFIAIPALFVTVGILSAILIFKFKSPTGENASVASQIKCETTGQLPDGISMSKIQYAESDPADNREEAKIIARLLKKNPLIIEIYDIEPWPELAVEELGISDELSLSKTASITFSNLGFNDLFEAKRYGYLVAGEELGFASGVYDVREINGTPSYYHKDVSDFTNRSGTLIKYVSYKSGKLVIFNDGEVLYEDEKGNALKGISMNADQINSLLEIFGTYHFDTLSSTDRYAQYEESVTLICKRYQHVPVKGNEAEIKPIAEKLEELILNLQTNFDYQLKYAEKKKAVVKQWPMENIVLRDVQKYHDEALNIYRSTNTVQSDHPAYTKIPDDLLASIPRSGSVTSVTDYSFFTDQGKTYMVTRGIGCVQGADVCQDGTVYMLQSKEIVSPQDKLEPINLWPSELGLLLSDIPVNGLNIHREQYQTNKSFLDLLSGEFLPGKIFLEGEYIYEGVHLVKFRSEQKSIEEVKTPYTLKIVSRHPISPWFGGQHLEAYTGMHTTYLKGDKPDDPQFTELKSLIPSQIDEMLKEERDFYFEDNGVYYQINSLHSSIGSGYITIFVHPLEKSSDNYFTGYLIWRDPTIALASIPEKGVMVSENFVEDNRLKLQFRSDKYYIQDGFLYILKLTREPV